MPILSILLLVVLALVVMTFVFLPLARGLAPRIAGRERFARIVYRDQLAELDRDRARGLIDAPEAETARREIERRLLAADRPDSARDARPRPLFAALLAVGTLVAAGGFYVMLGSPRLPDLPYADRATERAVAAHRMPPDLDKAVADLEKKLKADPNNLDGWILLGRTEAMRRHWQKSADAMRHAAALAPKRSDLVSAYGELQVLADGGLVTPTARDAFASALALQPKNAQALWYLGLEAVQQRKVGMAREYWQRLLAVLPADGSEHKTVAEALAVLDKAEKAARDAAPTAK